MTAKRVIWAVTAGLWMAAAAAGTAMGEEDTDKGPAYDTITEGVKKDVPKEKGPGDGTVAAGVKKSAGGWVKEDGSWRYKDSKAIMLSMTGRPGTESPIIWEAKGR